MFGVMPWNFERLYVDDLVTMCDTIDARNEAAKKAERERRR